MDVLSQTSIKVIDSTITLQHRKYMESASLLNISQCFFNAYSQVTFT